MAAEDSENDAPVEMPQVTPQDMIDAYRAQSQESRNAEAIALSRLSAAMRTIMEMRAERETMQKQINDLTQVAGPVLMVDPETGQGEVA